MKRVEKVFAETSTVKTIFLSKDEEISAATPGQFLMVWIPGVDEIPMSISSKTPPGITFRKVGEATDALFKLKEGDLLGVRGPLGKGFRLEGKRILVVGGGVGVAPLFPLVEDASREGVEVHVIIGARTGGALVFAERMARLSSGLVVLTEDGSVGFRGMAGDFAEKLIREKSYDQIYACGPEGMLLKVFQVAEEVGVGVQIALERYMKCGIGICGSCGLGQYLVCKDGPIFDGNMLRRVLDEFGVFRRDSYGCKEKVER
ncbi:MAG: dihydroorotate dehydrogenase electron transfer subunit [Candidatus Freyarchaeota archaeon]|nr:dihydroorotate dehydrogenase electron transfer subunit [Candidatus Jordarchaeia archaeon]